MWALVLPPDLSLVTLLLWASLSSSAEWRRLLNCTGLYTIGHLGQTVFSKTTMAIPSHIFFSNVILTFPCLKAGCTFLPQDHHHAVEVTACGLRLGHKRGCSFIFGFSGCSLWRNVAASLQGSQAAPGPSCGELRPEASNQR